MIARRAFSLIEVLIAVVALAIGLLGLAAVYPVIVGQQRDAANSTTGESFTKSVRAYLSAHADLNNPQRGWNALYDNIAPNPLGGNTVPEWEFDDLYQGTVETTLQWPAISGTDLFIPVSERLWPTRAASASRPRLVWDLAALTPLATLNGPVGPMRVAVFVRPVDLGIPDRAGAGNSAWDQILSGARVPIAENNDVPTRDGNGDYASLFELELEVYDFRTGEVFDGSEPGHSPNSFRVLSVTDGRTAQRTENALSRVGQRIVDRHGNVYRVTGSKATTDGLLLRVSPSVPSSVSGIDGDPDSVTLTELNPCLASTVAPVVDPFILEITP